MELSETVESQKNDFFSKPKVCDDVYPSNTHGLILDKSHKNQSLMNTSSIFIKKEIRMPCSNHTLIAIETGQSS